MEIYDDEEDIVTIEMPSGVKIDFAFAGGVVLNERFYNVMQAVTPLPGITDDDAFIFEVVRCDNGDEKFILVEDYELADIIFNEYNKILDRIEGKTNNN